MADGGAGRLFVGDVCVFRMRVLRHRVVEVVQGVAAADVVRVHARGVAVQKRHDGLVGVDELLDSRQGRRGVHVSAILERGGLPAVEGVVATHTMVGKSNFDRQRRTREEFDASFQGAHRVGTHGGTADVAGAVVVRIREPTKRGVVGVGQAV
ncbi:MAG: hypothetical protein CMI16_13095 [Opitutaceae bacterium]|nr:hypothetical protein [Opitutaceae bacterium]